LFIRIPKTASTSICHVLKPVEHRTALEWKETLGSEWDKKVVFSVVRNPFDRFVSMYYFFAAFGKAWKEDGVIKKKDINEWVLDNDLTKLVESPDYSFIKPQVEYLKDKEGNLMVNRIIRYENLNSEWDGLLQELGVPL